MRDRRNPFDELFGRGSNRRPWAEKMVEEFMASIEASGDNRVAEGRLIEVVDGDRREYELNEQGEWERLDNDGLLQLDEVDNGYEWTVDMSQILPSGSFEVSTTLNNGVLNVSFDEEAENEE